MRGFRYVGDDLAADMALLDNDPEIKHWWTYCEPCQEPLQWEGPPPSQNGKGGPGGAWVHVCVATTRLQLHVATNCCVN